MSAQPRKTLTGEESLVIERRNEYKSEYRDGEMIAMPCQNARHNLIVSNVIGELSGQLKNRPEKVFANNMRLKVRETDVYIYPDVIVVCGQEQFDDRQQDTLLNPTVIIEVLSPSTESYDCGAKFGYYRNIETLLEYILISQETPMIEQYLRQPDAPFWLFSAADSLQDVVELTSINCRLALAEVYDKVEVDSSFSKGNIE